MKKTIFTTAILFTLLSCSKDENTSGGANNSTKNCDYYRKEFERQKSRKFDLIRAQLDNIYYITISYKSNNAEISQRGQDSINEARKIIQQTQDLITVDSIYFSNEAKKHNCPF